MTGKISYRGNQDPIIETGAKLGTIERSYFPKMNWFSPKFWALGIVLSLLAWLLAALVLNYFMHAKVAEAAMLLHGSFARRLGIGFVAAIVIPVVVVLLFITIIGYYLAFLLMIWFVFACMVSSLFGAVYLGKLLYGYFDKNAAGITWPMIVVGVVVYKVLGWIPFLGWIVIAIFSLAAFGTILSLLWEQVKSFKLQRTNTK